MITLLRPAYYTAYRANKYCGTSADEKPNDEYSNNGDTFIETDTGNVYMFDKENRIWYKQPRG